MKKILITFFYIVLGIFFLFFMSPGFISLFSKAGLRFGYILIFSTTFAFLITPLFRMVAKRFGIMDNPEIRKNHKEPTPLLGGIAVFLSFAIALGLNYIFTSELLALLIASTIILVIGAIDDCIGLSARLRLIFQVLAVIILISQGICFRFLPPGILGNIGEWLLTFIWIIGITNAINFLDGMDGLATGLSAIMAIFIGIVAFQTDQPSLGWASAALVGACLGFLPYNLRPNNATIFLGDSGSTFLGFMLASLAIMGQWGPSNPIKAFAPPLLIFAIPIFDMIHISFMRIKNKKVTGFKEWIDFVGLDHVHHRLESLGLNKKLTVLMILLFELCLGSGALFIRSLHTIGTLVLVGQGIGIITIFNILEYMGNKKGIQKNNQKSMGLNCV